MSGWAIPPSPEEPGRAWKSAAGLAVVALIGAALEHLLFALGRRHGLW